MSWDIYFTAYAEQWILALSDTDYDAIMAAIELLEGTRAVARPAGRRPHRGSGHHHMKEFDCRGWSDGTTRR